MNKKMRNLAEMEYYSNFNLVGEVLKRLQNKYPENKTIKESCDAMAEIGVFVTLLMQEQYYYNKSLDSYKGDKLRAVERARRVEKELEELNLKNKI